MKYQQKYNRQKILITLLISVVMVGFILLIGFVIGPSMVSTIPQTTPPPSTSLMPVEGELDFEDEALVNAIKNQLGITGELTKADVEQMEVLDYDDEIITSLAGLEFAIKLKELRLKVDLVTIEPITGLQIEKLTFISPNASAQPLLEAMSEMVYLKYIDLTDCGISAIGYISELPILETLILDDNRIVGLSRLMNIKTLSVLSLRNCAIKDISAFKDNKMLRELYLDNNLITDISVIDTMLSLKKVTYEGNLLE